MSTIIVVNCNTNENISASIGQCCEKEAASATIVKVLTPNFGPESAEGYYESFVCAAAMLEVLETTDEEFDAVVLAGFGEHGVDGVRQRWNVPVVDITEAGAMVACLIARSFGVITSLSSTLPQIRDSLSHIGLYGRCAGVRASDVPVVSTLSHEDELAELLLPGAKKLLDDGAEALVLGCAGFAGLADALEERAGVPVIDSVGAGIRMTEMLMNFNVSTSKVGSYVNIDRDKHWKNWYF